MGRLDWITKRFLLEQTLEDENDLPVKKKIDIRYHELSPDGYYRRLETTGCTRAILSAEEIEDAIHFPPHDTPATKRSRYLRTFSRAEKTLRVNWNTITLGRGSDATTIELNDPEETRPNGTRIADPVAEPSPDRSRREGLTLMMPLPIRWNLFARHPLHPDDDDSKPIPRGRKSIRFPRPNERS